MILESFQRGSETNPRFGKYFRGGACPARKGEKASKKNRECRRRDTLRHSENPWAGTDDR